jgi:hypothetical protein
VLKQTRHIGQIFNRKDKQYPVQKLKDAANYSAE